jgi:hypothetical protein
LAERVARFDEIEVRRISIVDERGVMRMSLSGKPMHPGLFRGEVIVQRDRPTAGLLFFTEEGTECGGLTFIGRTNERGHVDDEAGLTMDAYEQDQVMWLHRGQRRGRSIFGLVLAEQPFSPLTEFVKWIKGVRKWAFLLVYLLNPRFRQRLQEAHGMRLSIGRVRGKDVGVFMYDTKGRRRIRMVVDGVDVPRMEFLNEAGKVTHALPPKEGSDGKV